MATINAEALLALETSLAERFAKRWRKLSTPVVSKMVKAIKAGKFADARDLLRTLDVGETLRGQEKFIDYMANSAMVFGASQFGDPKQSAVVKKGAGAEILPYARNQFEIMVRDATLIMQRRGDDMIDAAEKAYLKEKEKAVKADMTKNIKDLAKQAVTGSGVNSIHVVAGLHNSRLANYGYLTEALVLGRKTYTISEQLDIRICPVCERMHGKTFYVQPAYDRLYQHLTIDDPKDLKQLAPWPKQNKAALRDLQKMTNRELVAKGWDTPPYHPGCRGILLKRGGAKPLTEYKHPVAIPPEMQIGDLPLARPVIDMPEWQPVLGKEKAEAWVKGSATPQDFQIRTGKLPLLQKEGFRLSQLVNRPHVGGGYGAGFVVSENAGISTFGDVATVKVRSQKILPVVELSSTAVVPIDIDQLKAHYGALVLGLREGGMEDIAEALLARRLKHGFADTISVKDILEEFDEFWPKYRKLMKKLKGTGWGPAMVQREMYLDMGYDTVQVMRGGTKGELLALLEKNILMVKE